MRHVTLAILAALTIASGASAGEMLAELRADRLDYFLNASFSRYGLEPLKTIGLERSGVHFRINRRDFGEALRQRANNGMLQRSLQRLGQLRSAFVVVLV